MDRAGKRAALQPDLAEKEAPEKASINIVIIGLFLKPVNKIALLVSGSALAAVLLQRIFLSARNTGSAVPCRRVGTASLRKGGFLHARSTQQPWKGVISLVAARLIINSVRLLALLDELLRDR